MTLDPYLRDADVTLYHGDSRDIIPHLDTVDAVVTDPPYGLRFMGKRWDHDVPSVELWQLVLERMKPGAHLLAFAGTRTQHRMACNIEDAGFEIRDMIAWVYGSGFPKSLDVSKAIDGAAGAEREDVYEDKPGVTKRNLVAYGEGLGVGLIERRPVTDAARQWEGWGTALKPSLETLTLAVKPSSSEQERGIIQSNLLRLEARLWLLSPANAAASSSASSRSEYAAACATAQWSAADATATRDALCAQMDTLQYAVAADTSLSIVSSWRRTLAAHSIDTNTSTTETASGTTTDWTTLRFSLSQITPECIIVACSRPGGFSANASPAANHFSASLSLWQSIRTLSATARVMSRARHEHLGAAVAPNLDPCIVARKPLEGTVAENVLRHGTGGINVAGCRVGTEGGVRKVAPDPSGGAFGGAGFGCNGPVEPVGGRWPSNLIHDGSDEVEALFPADSPSHSGGTTGYQDTYVGGKIGRKMARTGYDEVGSAARFYYCSKASKADRGYGNTHSTVKPIDLMRYLCRLVTPPGGVILDPFAGSGSTLLAARLEGFRAIGIELELEHCETTARRLAQQSLFAEVPA